MGNAGFEFSEVQGSEWEIWGYIRGEHLRLLTGFVVVLYQCSAFLWGL